MGRGFSERKVLAAPGQNEFLVSRLSSTAECILRLLFLLRLLGQGALDFCLLIPGTWDLLIPGLAEL